MGELLTKQRIAVNTDLDRVVLSVARTAYPMPYAAANKIAAGMRLASKRAMRISGEPVRNWRAISRVEYYPEIKEIAPLRRMTLTRQFDWSVQVDGERVILILGNCQAGFHFHDALKVSQWLKHAARQAKAWAGDSSKSVVSIGYLTDAEDNYKHGY